MAKENRLIDPAEYKSFLKRYINDFYEIDAPMIAGAVERCLQKLEMQPTVDAVEVVHGRWEERYAPNGKYVAWDGFYCSVCGKQAAKSNYCPNCGAKMDGERKDNG